MGDGATPLWIAAKQGQCDVVGLVLAVEGVQVNKASNRGVTPLYVAAQEGHGDVVRLLLAMEGVQVNKASKRGVTPLYVDAQEDHGDVVRLLLAMEGVQVNKASKRGVTQLLMAARKGHGDVVGLLLAIKSVQVNKEDKDRKQPVLGRLQKYQLEHADRASSSGSASSYRQAWPVRHTNLHFDIDTPSRRSGRHAPAPGSTAAQRAFSPSKLTHAVF